MPRRPHASSAVAASACLGANCAALRAPGIATAGRATRSAVRRSRGALKVQALFEKFTERSIKAGKARLLLKRAAEPAPAVSRH